MELESGKTRGDGKRLDEVMSRVADEAATAPFLLLPGNP